MSEARERLAAAQEGRRQRGLHPKGTDQTYEEQTRVLMTWTKAELVRSLIREESDKLKAIDQLIDARAAQAVSLPDRETLGEIIALTDDYDGCHARVREWEALEQWERDAYPEDYPSSDYEDAECWNRRADAVLAALSTQPAGFPQDFAVDVPGGQFLPSTQPAAGEAPVWVKSDGTRHSRPVAGDGHWEFPAAGEVEWGVYAQREGQFYSVTPATRENAEREAKLTGAGHRPVTAQQGRELRNAWSHGRMSEVERQRMENPTPAPELFPGTLAALNKLTIRGGQNDDNN